MVKPEIIKIGLMAVGWICSMISFAVLSSTECDDPDSTYSAYKGRDFHYYPSLEFAVGFGVLIWIMLSLSLLIGVFTTCDNLKEKIPELLQLDSQMHKWIFRFLCFFAYTAAVASSSVNTFLVDPHDDDDTSTIEFCDEKVCNDFCQYVAAGTMFMWFTFFALLFLIVYQDIEIWRMCAGKVASSSSSDGSLASKQENPAAEPAPAGGDEEPAI